jgi:adenylate cyclase class IV
LTRFREIETKYSAEGITLTAFQDFCEGRDPGPISRIDGSGFDHFYSNPGEPDTFYRHRIGPEFNQLTFKRKTIQGNSNIRVELNVDLDPKTPKETIAAMVGQHGYAYNTSLFKTYFVYFYDWYVLSYYVVCDKDMKELGRYLEIEANEDHPWKTEQEAWDAVMVMEKLCKPLGITPQMRIKKSLFELYKNDKRD